MRMDVRPFTISDCQRLLGKHVVWRTRLADPEKHSKIGQQLFLYGRFNTQLGSGKFRFQRPGFLSEARPFFSNACFGKGPRTKNLSEIQLDSRVTDKVWIV